MAPVPALDLITPLGGDFATFLNGELFPAKFSPPEPPPPLVCQAGASKQCHCVATMIATQNMCNWVNEENTTTAHLSGTIQVLHVKPTHPPTHMPTHPPARLPTNAEHSSSQQDTTLLCALSTAVYLSSQERVATHMHGLQAATVHQGWCESHGIGGAEGHVTEIQLHPPRQGPESTGLRGSAGAHTEGAVLQRLMGQLRQGNVDRTEREHGPKVKEANEGSIGLRYDRTKGHGGWGCTTEVDMNVDVDVEVCLLEARSSGRLHNPSPHPFGSLRTVPTLHQHKKSLAVLPWGPFGRN